MKRRKFLFTSGAFATSAAIMSMMPQSVSAFENTSSLTEDKRDNYKIFSEPVLQAIAIGLNAPNAHNTQAWRFKIVNDKEALLYIDLSQILPATDPPCRQIHISAGCLIEAISIGATGIGYKTEIKLFPNGNYTTKDIGLQPVANIQLVQSGSITKHKYWDYIFKRKTSRMVYNGPMVTQQEFDEIKNNSDTQNSQLIFINDAPSMEIYSKLFSKAMNIEFNTLATNEETRKNFRFTDDEAAKKRDGLTFDGNGFHGIQKFLARTFTKNTLESWNKPSTIDKGFANFEKGVQSSKGFVLWITKENEFKDHIEIGRDFYRFCLSLTAKNLYMHPLTQATQEYKELDSVRDELNKLMNIKGGEKIQMIVRIGRSDTPFESYRRHVKDIITL